MNLLILTVLIVVFSLVNAKPMPLPQLPRPLPAVPPPLTPEQVQQALYGMPRSGIVGMADNLGAGLSNFGNGQGSAWDALISAVFNAMGNLMSGIFGSGIINTKFPNYNNRPFGGANTPRPGGAGAGGARPPAGGAPAEEPAEEERK